MARNLILCLDGTNNRIGDHQTNVVRFFRGLDLNATQIPYYVQGIGTVRSQDVTKPEPLGDRVRGMAAGRGLEEIVLDAYRFLCTTFDFEAFRDPKKDSDKIYFMGFSRGAYAARMLAGFINEFGLLSPNNLHMAVHAFRAYLKLTEFRDDTAVRERYLMLRRLEGTFHPEHPAIDGLILFDTVASMIRWRNPIRSYRKYWSPISLANHPSTVTNPSVRFVIHAVAVDERRTFFRPLMWREGERFWGNRFRQGDGEPQIVRQVWFPGCHGDVAGSAREDEAGLGKITACWVFDQLAELALNLKFRANFFDRYLKATSRPQRKTEDGRRISEPHYNARIHHSLRGMWMPMEIIPKSQRRRDPSRPFFKLWPYYFPLGEPRPIPPEANVHPSVFDRRDHGQPTYAPRNLAGRTQKDFRQDASALHNPSYPGEP